MPKTEEQSAYERGYQDGFRAGRLTALDPGLSKPEPKPEPRKSYCGRPYPCDCMTCELPYGP